MQAGTIHRRVTLCGEMGLPDQVENTSASGAVRLTRAGHSVSNASVDSASGTRRVADERLGVDRVAEHAFNIILGHATVAFPLRLSVRFAHTPVSDQPDHPQHHGAAHGRKYLAHPSGADGLETRSLDLPVAPTLLGSDP